MQRKDRKDHKDRRDHEEESTRCSLCALCGLRDLCVTSAHQKRTGFAAIFAIMLILLVGSALSVLGSYFRSDFTRTRAHQNDAQLRQLLTTAAAVAIHRADHPAPDDAIALPATLAADGASLSLHVTGEGDDRTATVHARLGQRSLEQTLKLRRTNGRWNVP